MERFYFKQGTSPLLISIPHDGYDLAPGMETRISKAGRSLPDTDWHVRKLYEFSDQLSASILAARFSRYVVDLNRSSSDVPLYEKQLTTELCPLKTFDGEDIYTYGDTCEKLEQLQRIKLYWQPYHDALDAELKKIVQQYGYALLWDAHSIRSKVPNLFSGTLPDINIGSNNGKSCDAFLQCAVYKIAQKSDYSVVINDRFKGGYITRNYGNPSKNIHAVQLELAQHLYMNEKTLRYDKKAATRLSDVLMYMLREFINQARLTLNSGYKKNSET
ncbi:MAG: N-formylglutamate deformylase [Candidatus Rariloculaceae bacterium]